MGADSKIEWTHHTFNPWWGCARVSPGCERCYAESFAHRLGRNLWGVKAERRYFSDEHWEQPVRWNAAAAKVCERRRVFCASMADVFEDREDLRRERVRLFQLIATTPHLDWLLLTKRPENVLVQLRESMAMGSSMAAAWLAGCAPANVWLGTTVEDQRRANERIPHLLSVAAAVRFLSCEPLLERIDLTDIPYDWAAGVRHRMHALRGYGGWERPRWEHKVDWVIVGGESGHGARPMHPAWARALRDQCTEAGVSFFFKQWGEFVPIEHHPGGPTGAAGYWPIGRTADHHWGDGDVGAARVGKKVAGREFDGREWNEYPAVRP